MKKVYFSHYDLVWSYPLADAIAVAVVGADGRGCFHQTDVCRAKKLKGFFRTKNEMGRPITPARFRGKPFFVCLDWEKADWESCLDALLKMREKGKAGRGRK